MAYIVILFMFVFLFMTYIKYKKNAKNCKNPEVIDRILINLLNGKGVENE